MELNFERDYMNCYDLVLDTSIYQEETLEAIVPDACPDILRIVDAGGQVCLLGKNVFDGGVSLSGTIRAWVLYQPEEQQELCRVEMKLPFTIQTEATGLNTQGQCVVTPCLRGVDARALNPRKMLLRADVGAVLQAFQPKELLLCRCVSCDESAGVQQYTTGSVACVTAVVQEKEFSFYDEVRLSAGPAGPAELLCAQADVWCTESKLIGNKLIFKGELALQIRYQVEGELCSMRCPMAFSQIMEVSGTGETASCDLSMCVTDLNCVLAGEDHRMLNVTVELLGQAVVQDQVPVTLLQDMYSTVYDMVTQQELCTFCQLEEHAVRPQSVRELLEIGTPVKQVIDATVCVSQMKQSRQDEQVSVSADLSLKLLCLDEQNMPQAFQRILTVSGRLDLPPQGSCQCRCLCPGEIFAVPSAGGVEVRLNPQFQYTITRRQTVPVITGGKLGEPHAAQQERQPSVVLRLAAPGETLWDIAKSYFTTQERILQANQLEGDTLPTGQMLLIPSVR